MRKKLFFLLVSLFPFCALWARQILAGTAAEILTAINGAVPADTIYIRGGTYVFGSTIKILRSGNPASRICLANYPNDNTRPRFDFSSMAEARENKGLVLNADYWHIKGLDVYKAGNNGLSVVKGNYNIIEFCTASECYDTGILVGTASSNNLVLNCDSYYNADSKKEDADGFACKTAAGTNNKFIGCRAWQNLDDGYDGYMRGADNISTLYENCWAFKNGYLKDGRPSEGDGNGFKTGGSDTKDLKHNAAYKNCLSSGNAARGYDQNSNRGIVMLFNCTAHNNRLNFYFGPNNPVFYLVIKNCAVLGPAGTINVPLADVTHNSWQNNPPCTDADFQSTDVSQLLLPRKPDGGLPNITYLKPAAGSRLIDKGVNVGLPYKGAAPDLGAFEYRSDEDK